MGALTWPIRSSIYVRCRWGKREHFSWSANNMHTKRTELEPNNFMVTMVWNGNSVKFLYPNNWYDLGRPIGLHFNLHSGDGDGGKCVYMQNDMWYHCNLRSNGHYTENCCLPAGVFHCVIDEIFLQRSVLKNWGLTFEPRTCFVKKIVFSQLSDGE